MDQTTKTYLVDIGSNVSGRNTPTPYNNFTISGNASVPISSSIKLNSTMNQKSNLILVVNSSNWVVQDNGITTDSTYLGSAMRDSFGVLYVNTGTMSITGCDDSKTYTVKLLQSRSTSGAVVNTTVNSVMKSQDITGNITPLIWTNVKSISGVINISTVSMTSSRYAQMNVIELLEF